MEKQFAAVTKDRDSLYDQLSSTIDEVEALETKALYRNATMLWQELLPVTKKLLVLAMATH